MKKIIVCIIILLITINLYAINTKVHIGIEKKINDIPFYISFYTYHDIDYFRFYATYMNEFSWHSDIKYKPIQSTISIGVKYQFSYAHLLIEQLYTFGNLQDKRIKFEVMLCLP